MATNHPPLPGAEASNVRFFDMGRPLDPDWVDNFEDILSRMPANEARGFIPLERPGVCYAPADNVSLAARRQTVIEGAESTAQAVDLLIDQGIIDGAIALAGTTVSLRAIRSRATHRKNEWLLRAIVGDYPRPDKQGFIVETEKLAIADPLQVDIGSREHRENPQHNLNLGKILARREPSDRFLSDLRRSLPIDRLGLDRVGEMSLSPVREW